MKITDMKNYPAAASEAYADPALAPELDALAETHKLLDAFQAARVCMGISFDECARRMGIGPDELEAIDSGTDADLSHNQIAAYVSALFPLAVPRRPARRKTATPAPRGERRRVPALALA